MAIVKRDKNGYTNITGISTTELLALAEALIAAPREDQLRLTSMTRGLAEAIRQTGEELEENNEHLLLIINRNHKQN